jgi:hypothetical protein
MWREASRGGFCCVVGGGLGTVAPLPADMCYYHRELGAPHTADSQNHPP